MTEQEMRAVLDSMTPKQKKACYSAMRDAFMPIGDLLEVFNLAEDVSMGAVENLLQACFQACRSNYYGMLFPENALEVCHV